MVGFAIPLHHLVVEANQPDMARFAAVAHLAFAKLSSRLWVEWIDSKSNPSDGVSREGISDELAHAFGARVAVARKPDFERILRGAMKDALAAVVT